MGRHGCGGEESTRKALSHRAMRVARDARTRERAEPWTDAKQRLLCSRSPRPLRVCAYKLLAVALMSSDDYFFDDELDSAFLNEVDAIEAAHTLPPRTTTAAVARPGSPPRQPFPARSFIDIEDSDPFDAFDFDVAVLQDIHEGRVQPPGPSKPPAQRTSSRNTIQTTLLGGVVQDTSRSKPKSSTKSSFQRTNSVQTTLTEKRTKQWDRTAFAKSGWRQTAEDKARKKGKERASFDNDDGDERVEFEQFPAPFVPIGCVVSLLTIIWH